MGAWLCAAVCAVWHVCPSMLSIWCTLSVQMCAWAWLFGAVSEAGLCAERGQPPIPSWLRWRAQANRPRGSGARVSLASARLAFKGQAGQDSCPLSDGWGDPGLGTGAQAPGLPREPVSLCSFRSGRQLPWPCFMPLPHFCCWNFMETQRGS